MAVTFLSIARSLEATASIDMISVIAAVLAVKEKEPNPYVDTTQNKTAAPRGGLRYSAFES
ncbi:hypothetical protein KDL45_01000, partial [bacterium]|nr:hypothetical protein [bacterium]